jgi:uncharacterized membrane protein YozB (DUF420 family)
MVEFWLVLVMVISLIALFFAMMFIHSKAWQKHDKTFRVGFILLCLGLGVQTFRSIHFLQFGAYPIDEYFPTWLTKDFGFCLMIYSKFNESRNAP